jgi:YesN/AraC family two-component response regulator
MQLRIRKALKLLKNPEAKVDNVIKESGFVNRGLFYKYFMKCVGVTPADYKSYSNQDKEVMLDIFQSKKIV